MKRLLLTAMAVIALALGGTTTSVAHTPPGNDGGYCHGANHETCRPDPQPSHGQDCQAHGNNPDGNDDHCASPTPSASVEPSPTATVSPSDEPTPSTQPSPSNSPEPTTAPTPAPTATASPTAPPASSASSQPSTPSPTLPPTDILPVAGGATGSGVVWIAAFLMGAAGVLGSFRRLRR